MKTATATEIKKALSYQSKEELLQLCLRLSRFKKENKELLTYLLFEADDESGYIEGVKSVIDEHFENINTKSYFYIRKSIRKIYSITKKHIRYSLKKETEVVLLLYFCQKLIEFTPSIKNNTALCNLFNRVKLQVQKTILKLHEDLQYDYNLLLEDLTL